MKFLLLALACLMSAAKEPLPFSGKFSTIFLAGKDVSTTAENSQFRMLMCEVKYFNEYRLMSMTFYVRKNGICQLHTIWADKRRFNHCSILAYFFRTECPKTNGTDSIAGIWKVRDAARHFPNIYFHSASSGGLIRRSSEVFIEIHYVSNTTILFELLFLNVGKYSENLTGALATGANITEEMQEEYKTLTQERNIPTKNIENVYATDACPKLEP